MSDNYDIQGTILNSAFWNDKQDKYTIPQEVTQIADAQDGNSGAFSQFKSKKFTVTFSPNSQIQIIGDYSFYGCRLLQSIDFTNAAKLREIRNYAFSSCTSLKTVSFPQSLETFGFWGAFSFCSSLTQVTFPANSQLTLIHQGTFFNCPLKSFTFPKKCRGGEFLGPAFGKTQIEAFEVEDESENLAIYKGSVYNKDFSVLYIYNKGNEFELHPSTTSIEYYAFSGSKCPHVIFPKTITNINQRIFYGFLGTKITMLSAPETIKDEFFRDCINLEELVLGEGLKSITYTTYKALSTNGRLKSLYVPYSLESIDSRSIDSKDFKACFYGNVEVVRKTYETLSTYKVNNCYIGIKISINNNRHIFLSKSISNFLFVLSTSV